MTRRLHRHVRALSVCALAAVVATCRETTTGPGRTAQLALAPILPSRAELAAFAITADTVRVIVVRPAADTLADQIAYFSPDSTSLALTVSVNLIANTEDLDVTIELRGGGVALFSGTQTLSVSVGSNPPGPPIVLSFIGPGTTVDTLKVTPLDSVITLNDSLRFQVTAVDALGNPVTQFYVSWTTSDTTVARANGLGVVRAPGARGAVYVTAQTPNGRRDSTRVTFIPVPTSVTAVSGMGQSGPPGTALALPLVAQVKAADNLGVTGIAVHFSAPPNGAVTTATVITDSLGFAQTTATLSTNPGTGNFQALVFGLTAATFPATVVAATATQLVITTQPAASTVAGTPLGTITVQVRDALNQVVPGAALPVTIALGANPGGATLAGTTTLTPTNGLVTFPNLNLTKVAAGYTLVVTAAGLSSDTSSAITITPAAPSQLAFTAQPGNIIAGAAFAANLLVEIRDQFGNLTVATDSIALGITPGTATLLGTTKVAAVNGVATFSGVSVNKAATNYTLSAAATGLIAATSQLFDVAPATAAQLAVTSFPATVISGQAFTAPVVAEAQDSFGNLAPSFSGPVTIGLGANPNGGTLSGALTAAAVAGTASFPGLQIDNPGAGYTLVATGGGLSADTSGAITVAPPTAGQYWIAAAGGLWSNPANWSTNTVPGATDTVFIALGGTYTVTVDVSATVAFLFLGGATGTQTLAVTGQTLGIDSAGSIAANGIVAVSSGSLNTATGTLLNQGAVQLFSATVAGTVVNGGTIRARGSSTFSGDLTTTTGSSIAVEGDALCCGTTLTVSNGLLNTGTIDLSSINVGGNTAQLIVAGGPLINTVTGVIRSLPGTAGARFLNAVLDNQGTVQVDQSLDLNVASAVHTNAGSIVVGPGATLAVQLSGAGTAFNTSGSVVVDSGGTLAVSGGPFNYGAGALAGRGSVTFSNATLDLGPTLINDTLTLSFASAAVTGSGVLANATGRTLALFSSTIGAAFDNHGVLQARGSSALNGPVTTNAGSTIRVEGDAFCCAAALTAANGFINSGTIELTSINSGGNSSQLLVTSGTLVNAPGATIASLAGTGGSRTVTAAVDNQGTLQVDQPLTLNGSSVDHLNSGTIAVNQDLTITQGGTTPSFGTTGTIAIALGHTLTVNNGAFDYNGGTVGGLGALAFTNVVLGLGQSLTNDTLALSFSSSTVNGPGTLGNASGRTIVLFGTTVNAPLVNQGLVVTRGSSTFNGAVTTTPASTLRIEGDAFCCGAGLTVATGFTNYGTIDLTAINSGGNSSGLVVTSGALVNDTGATLVSSPGSGGSRFLTAALDNRGTVQIDQPLTINGSSAVHVNSGTIAVNQDLTLTQGGTTPSFGTSGTIAIAAGRTMAVNNGAFDYTGGNSGGLGALAFNNVTVGLGRSLVNDTLALSFASSVVNGPDTLGNAAGRTLLLFGTTVNAPLDNHGVVTVRGASAFNGAVTAAAGSTLRVEGDANCCGAALTVATGFTNNGTIELTAINGGGNSAQFTVTAGTLVNDIGATLVSLPGTGGSRTVTAALDNRGTLQIDQPLTINGSGVDHLNSGAIAVNQDLTITQGGTTPTFGTSGTLTVAAGHTVAVNGGTFDYTGGTIGGLGTLAFTNVTVGLGIGMTNDTLALTFASSVVNGPGVLGNASGRAILLFSTTVNAPLVNQGLLTVRGASAFNDNVTAAAGSTLRVEGDANCCGAALTVATGFTNNGAIELTAINGGGNASQLAVTAGALVNDTGATLASLPGTGGPRTITAALDNRGSLQVDQPLTVNGSSAVHANSGAIAVNQDLTITQGGTTPSFGTSGAITIAAGHVLAVNSGAFDYTGGAIGGLGSLSFTNVTVGLAQSLTNDTLALAFASSTVNGPGTLANASGRSLVLFATAVNAPLANQGTLVTRGASSFNGAVSTAPGSIVRVEGDANCCGAALNVTTAGGLTNAGKIELSAINGGGNSSQLSVSGGPLVNDTGATLSSLPGTGGARTVTATLDNRGLVQVDQALVINGASAAHVNTGLITLGTGDLTVSQGGITPSFHNAGVIAPGAGLTFRVTGGTFANDALGTLAGSGIVHVAGAAAFTDDGAFSPGASPGVLSLVGDPPMSPSAALNIEIGGTTPGTQYDQLAINGTATLGGTLNVSLTGGFVPAVGDTFAILTASAVGNTFGVENLPTLPIGAWQVTYTAGAVVLRVNVSAGQAPVVKWTNLAGGNWNNASNWSTGLVPSVTDSVVIDTTGTYAVTLDVNATVYALQLGGAAGTQTLTNAAQTLTLTTGGIVGANGHIDQSGGTLTGGGTLTVDGVMNWSGGTISGAGLTQIGSTGALNITGPVSLTTRTIQNAGTVLWTAGNISSGGGALLRTLPGGTLDVQANASWLANLGAPAPRAAVLPGGTLVRRVGTGTVSIAAAVDDSGLVDVQSGHLVLVGGGAGNGTYTVAAGDTLEFGGGTHTLDATSAVGGAGDVAFTAGSTTLGGAYDVTGATTLSGGTTDFNTVDTARVASLALSGGTLGGTGIVRLGGTGTWTSGGLAGAGELRIAAGAALTVTGTAGKSLVSRLVSNAGLVTWTAGQLNSGQGAVLRNDAGGVFDLPGTAAWQFNQGGAVPQLNNLAGGLVTRTVSAGVAGIGAALNNDGTVDVQTGTLQVSGGGTSGGAFTTAAGAVLDFAGGAHVLTTTASIGGGGDVTFSNGTVAVGGVYDLTGSTNVVGGTAAFNTVDTARTTALVLSSGSLDGTGVVLLRSSGSWTAGGLAGTGELRIAAGAGLTVSGASGKTLVSRLVSNAGLVTWTAGQLNSGQGAVFRNDAGGVFDVQGTATWQHNQGGVVAQLDNLGGGLVTRTVSGGVAGIAVNLNNAGTVDVETGTLQASNGGTSSGAFTAAAGATLDFAGGTHTLSSSSSIAGSGDVTFSTGTVLLGGAYDLSGSTNISGGTADFGTVDTARTTTLTLSAGTLTGNAVLLLRAGGTGSWTGGGLDGTGAGELRVESGAGLTISGASGKTFAGRTLSNAGLVTWTGGQLNSGQGAVFRNDAGGVFDLQGAANLVFNQGGVPTQVTNLAGGQITRTVSTAVAAIGVALNNDGAVDVLTGTLQATGGGTSGGAFTAAPASALEFGGTHVLTASSAVGGGGDVNFTTGTVNLGGSYDVTGVTNVAGGTATFNTSDTARTTGLSLSAGTIDGTSAFLLRGTGSWTAGVITGSGELRVGAGAALTVSGASGRTLTARTLSNAGLVTWTGGQINSGQGAQFRNDPGGLFDLQANAGWFYNQGGVAPTITNLPGAIVQRSGAGTTRLDDSLDNGGTLAVTGGTLQVTRAFVNDVGAVVQGAGVFDLTGATTVQNLGSVAPGASPGILTILPDWPFAASGSLDIELGGTAAGSQYDQLAVGNTATLAGGLDVLLINGFTPVVGDSFRVVSYAAKTGTLGSLSLPPLPIGSWQVNENPTGVDLIVLPTVSGNLISWVGPTSGTWSNAANWSPATVPTSADTALIVVPGTYTVTLDVDATVGKLRVGAGVGAIGTQTLSGSGRTLTLGAGSVVDAKGVLSLSGNSTLTGTGTLSNLGQVSLTGSTANLAIDNQGLLAATTSTLNGQVTTGGADTVRVGAGGPGTVTFAKGFTVNGRLQFRIPAGTNTLAVTQGPLTIAPAGRFDMVAAGGSAGTLTAALVNQGTVSVISALTINGVAAAHDNSGTLDLSNGILTIQQSGAGAGLVNNGTILVPANQSFTINGGTYAQTATAVLSGAGTANFTALTAGDFASPIAVKRVTIDGVPTTLAASQSLGGRWSVTNATLTGPATWTIGPNDSLDLTGGTVGIALDNQGVIRAVGVVGINGPLTTAAGSFLRLGLLPGASTGGGTITFANGFTNNGTLVLQSLSGSTLTTVVTAGSLLNAAGGTLLSDPSGLGIRRITAPIDNQGTFTVNQSVTLNPAAGVHTSAGLIDIANGQTLLVGNAGALTLSGSGKAQGAGTLDVTGALTTLAGTVISVDTLRAGGVLTVGGGFTPGTTIFTGAAQTIPVLPYGNVTVTPSTGTAKFAGVTTITGDLVKAGAGTTRLDLNGQFVTVTGNLTVAGGAVLWTLPASSMTVQGSATFQGAGTSGLMTAGTLRVAGDLTQIGTVGGGTDASFKPTLSHLTILNGTAAQTVSFQTPGYIGLSSQFANLTIANTSSAGVTLASNANVATTLASPGGGPRPVGGFFRIAGGGKTLTVKGVDADSLDFDNTPVVVDSGGTITSFNAIRFQNYAPTGIALDVTGTLGQVTFSNLVFLTTPTTGFHLRVNDPVTGNGRFTVNLSAPTPTAAGGAKFTTTGEGLINWP